MMFVLAGLLSCDALGLVFLLFSYFDLTLRPSSSVGYYKGFCLVFKHTTLGNRRVIFGFLVLFWGEYFHFKLCCQQLVGPVPNLGQ